MRGDIHYIIQNSGSTATSAGTAHGFFGAYQGLSSLHPDDVVHIQASASAGGYKFGAGSNIGNDVGIKIDPAASVVDLPPMRAAYASQLHFVREAGNNVTAFWTIWLRR